MYKKARNLFSTFSNRGIGNRYDKTKAIYYGIIVANVGVFAAWQQAGNDWSLMRYMTNNFTVSRVGVTFQHKYHTLVTSFFSHADFSHLLFNMLAFATFGNSAIQCLSPGRFALLYFGGGLFASLSHVYASSLIPYDWPGRRKLMNSPALGASGAVNALVMWSVCTFPRSTIYVFIFPVPAVVAGLGFVTWDFYNAYVGHTNIGSIAHLGGAFYGATFYAWTRKTR